MKTKFKKQRLIAEINITPFTDVILVLLVIFMISTPLIYQTSIKVKLPEAKSGKPIESTKYIQANVMITDEGVVYLDNEIVTRKELKARMNTIYRSHPDLSVILRSDRMARFKDIVDVLDVLTEVGVTKLDIACDTSS